MPSELRWIVETELFERRPFFVRAVPVTLERLDEIAEWCGGSVQTQTVRGKRIPYINVPVLRPRFPKQTQAFEGDWIVQAGTGFKVYTHANFIRDFRPVSDEDLRSVLAIETSIDQEFERTRQAAGPNIIPQKPAGLAALARFQFQNGLQLNWNTKEKF